MLRPRQQSANTQRERGVKLTGAELRAESFSEGRNNLSTVLADLRIRERRFAALERHAHEERIFSGGNIFPAEKIRGFDGRNFSDAERLNRLRHVEKLCAIGEQQGKVAFDARESWQRLIPARFFRCFHRSVNRIEFQLRQKNVLPQFKFFGDTPRELARNAK